MSVLASGKKLLTETPVKEAQLNASFLMLARHRGLFVRRPAMREAIIRQGFGNWLVILGTKSDTYGLVKLEVADRFKTRAEAEKKAELFNYVMRKCAEFTARQTRELRCAIY